MFPFAPSGPFPPFSTLPCAPGGWPGRTASMGQPIKGTGRRREVDREVRVFLTLVSAVVVLFS